MLVYIYLFFWQINDDHSKIPVSLPNRRLQIPQPFAAVDKHPALQNKVKVVFIRERRTGETSEPPNEEQPNPETKQTVALDFSKGTSKYFASAAHANARLLGTAPVCLHLGGHTED